MFSAFPEDVANNVLIPMLDVQDLGRCMRIDKATFQRLMPDPAWNHIKQRLIERVPMFQEYIFDAFPWRDDYGDNGRKRKATLRESKSRRNVFKTPRGGTWYCLKTFVGKARNAKTIRGILKQPYAGSFLFGSRTFLSPGLRLDVKCNVIHTHFTHQALPMQTHKDKIRRAKIAVIASLPFLQSEENNTETFELTGNILSLMCLSGKNEYRIKSSGGRNRLWYCGELKYETLGFKEFFWPD